MMIYNLLGSYNTNDIVSITVSKCHVSRVTCVRILVGSHHTAAANTVALLPAPRPTYPS